MHVRESNQSMLHVQRVPMWLSNFIMNVLISQQVQKTEPHLAVLEKSLILVIQAPLSVQKLAAGGGFWVVFRLRRRSCLASHVAGFGLLEEFRLI